MVVYGKKSQEKVGRAIHEMKSHKLKSGGSGKTVTSKKQAIAIGLSEARKAGVKVPRKPVSSQRGPVVKKKTAVKKRAMKRG